MVTLATGTLPTVTVEVSDTTPAAPGVLATMRAGVALAVTPVTMPNRLTAAIPGSRLIQEIVRPAGLRELPDASNNCTPNSGCEVPTVIEATLGFSTKLATGTAVTEMTAVAVGVLSPAGVILMFAVPGATAVTSPPLELTLATEAALELNEKLRPGRMLPDASRAVTVSCCVCPATSAAGVGETESDAMGTDVTVTVDTPSTAPIVARMVAVPVPTDEMMFALAAVPVFTVATATLLELHDTGRPVSTFPEASRAVAVTA